jgi:hypothetical protein
MRYKVKRQHVAPIRDPGRSAGGVEVAGRLGACRAGRRAAGDPSMETTFRLNYSPPVKGMSFEHGLVFEKLGRMLCDECGESCKGFFLADDLEAYQAHRGPKIAWAVDGPKIFLRLANCKRLDRVEEMSQFLRLFGMNIVESKLIQ